jgi:LacI family transcriptional regulator
VKKITIRDIAKEAGVSIGTVDRVLHQRGNVSVDVEARIKEVLLKHNFQKNLAASALASNKEYHIYIVLPKYSQDSYWQMPYEGIKRAFALTSHYGLYIHEVLFDQFDPENFMLEARGILDGDSPVSGVILAPIFYKESLAFMAELEQKKIPLVTINTMLDKGHYMTYIGQNSYQSGILAARLLNFSHNEEAVFVILNLEKHAAYGQHVIDKENGFRDYFKSISRTNVEVVSIESDAFLDSSALENFLQSLKNQFPKLSGVFVANSRAYKVAASLKGMYGDQLNIVGFDLIEPNIQHLTEGKIDFLINQNASTQGFEALNTLYRYLILKESSEHKHFLPLDIIVPENVEYYLSKKA